MDYKIIKKADPVTLEIYLNEFNYTPSGIYFISINEFTLDNIKKELDNLDVPQDHIEILLKKINFISSLVSETRIKLFNYIILVNKENGQNWLTIQNRYALKNKIIETDNINNLKNLTLKSKL